MRGKKFFVRGLILLSFVFCLGIFWEIASKGISSAADILPGGATSNSIAPTISVSNPNTSTSNEPAPAPAPATEKISNTEANIAPVSGTDTLQNTAATATTPLSNTGSTTPTNTATDSTRTSTPVSTSTTPVSTATSSATSTIADPVKTTVASGTKAAETLAPTAPSTDTSTSNASTTQNLSPLTINFKEASGNANTSTTVKTIAATPQTTNASQNTTSSSNTNSASTLPGFSPFTSPITESKELCVDFGRTGQTVSFRITGPKDKSFTTYTDPRYPTKYCFALVIDDLPNGVYKLITELKTVSGIASATNEIEIKKPGIVDTIIKTAASLLQDKCAELGIQDLEECKNRLIEKYAKDIKCQGLSDAECQEALKKTYSDTVIAVEEKYERIKEKTQQILGKDITINDLEKAINDGLTTPDASVPVQNKDVRVKALKVVETIVLDKSQGIIQAAPLAIAIDSDGDGIPDDIEKRIGTDPAKADTDGDGYNDSEEILNGYNPFGAGKREIALSPIEKDIIENITLEQPKASGTEKDTLTIENIKNVALGASQEQPQGNDGYVISGKAEPNSVATLYIYSDIPVVTTVTTDQYGNWEYHFDQPLEDGNHEIYIAINDNTGKVVNKSKPFAFPVKEAKAVSPADLANLNEGASKGFANMVYFYILSALVLIFFGILAFLFTVLRQKNKFNHQ